MPNLLHHTLIGLAALTLPVAACHAEPERGPALDLTGYSVTFEEEFDTLDVSPWGPGTRWIAHTPWNGDFGDARFADPEPGFPFTLEDGILRIEATKERSGKWEAGLLASMDKDRNGFKQMYGYFEISAKLPEGEGTWPAFWLVGESETHSSEIDIIEHYGKTPGRYSITVHEWVLGKPEEHQFEHHAVHVEKGSLYEDFHTYGVDIDEEEMRFYFDRQLVWTAPMTDVHHVPRAVLLNLALGGASPPVESTPDPLYMYVDYVRVWARDDQPAEDAG